MPENGRAWHKDPKTVVTAIIGVASIVVTIMIGLNSDFRVIISPMEGIVQQGGVIQTTASVEGILGYKYPVYLSASGQPSGVVVAIVSPIGGMKPTFTSNVILSVGTDVPTGKYEVIIMGRGADGKEHSIKYTLNVMPAVNVTPTLTPEPSSKLEINFISPKEGDLVPVSNIVRGTISGELQKGQYAWVVINPQMSPDQWWPQGRINLRNRQWDVPVFLGREIEDIGIKFDIAVILVNGKDDQHYLEYLRTGQENRSYPGEPLPESAEIVDRITVTRK